MQPDDGDWAGLEEKNTDGKVGSRRTEVGPRHQDRMRLSGEARCGYTMRTSSNPGKAKAKQEQDKLPYQFSVQNRVYQQKGKKENEKRESEREIKPVSDASSAHKKARDHEGTSQDGRSEPRQRKKKLQPIMHDWAFWQIGSPSYISQVSRMQRLCHDAKGGDVGRPIGGRERREMGKPTCKVRLTGLQHSMYVRVGARTGQDERICGGGLRSLDGCRGLFPCFSLACLLPDLFV
ncbi:hypothetical protein HDV62DRAFT_212327 [Trichoderma sp. SZMC 28011]